MTLAAAYALVVAVVIVGLWIMSFATGGVPERRTRPREIALHVAAELMMAATLAAGGLLTLGGTGIGPIVLLVAFGMTLYSIVNSSGYYLERRELPPTVMFLVLFVLTLAATVTVAGSLT